MKTRLYGRILFGASAVLFGAIALLWRDADTWQALHRIATLRFGATVGVCLMAAQIAGGIGIAWPRTARAGSTVLGLVYLVFSLVCLAGIVAAPGSYDRYPSFFEQFSLLCGAVAVFASTEANRRRAAALGRASRIGLGACAASFAVTQMVYFSATAGLVPKWIPPNQKFWAIVTTVAFALAAVAMLINRGARPAARLLTLMLALFGVLVWIPLLMRHPRAHFNWSEFALTCLITGAAWVVANPR